MSTLEPSWVDGWRVVRAAPLFMLVLVCSCAEDVGPTHPNVVLIIVDTLRADRMAFNGCPQSTAPFLEDLACRSLVFENAWSPSSWTLPATVSILTSVHPFQHGVTNLAGLELEPGEEPVPINCIPEELETLAESLRAAGYRTYGVVSNLLVGAEVGFDRGFDRFVQLQDEDADAVNGVVSDWHEEMLAQGPFFLYLHYIDPHDTYHAREPWFEPARSRAESGWSEEFREDAVDPDQIDWFMSRLDPKPDGLAEMKAREFSPSDLRHFLAWCKAAYDSEIGFVDARIRDIFEMLDLEDSIVVFLSDHGEEFYEHGHLTHGQNLYGETMRVPLFLYLPDEGAPRGRVAAHVSTLDIAPTLRRLLRLPALDQDQGQDLLGDATRQPVFGSLAGKSGQHELEEDLRSIIRGDHRLIVQGDGPGELYDLASDPLERTDLADELPEVVAELLRELDGVERSAHVYPRATRLPSAPSEAMLEHLRGIGYSGD